MKSLLCLILFWVLASTDACAQSTEWYKYMDPQSGSGFLRICEGAFDSIHEQFVLGGNFSGTFDLDMNPNSEQWRSADSGTTALFVAAYDLNGNLLWDNVLSAFGVTDIYRCGADRNGDVLITGVGAGIDFDPDPNHYVSFTNGNGYSPFIAKYDGSSGSFVWAKQLECKSGAVLRFLSFDAHNNIYVAADFFDSLDVDPDTTSAVWLNLPDDLNTALIKLNENGEYVWHKHIYGPDRRVFQIGPYVNGILAENEKVSITGIFIDTLIIDGDSSTALVANQGFRDQDVYIIQYDTSGTLLRTKQIGGYGMHESSFIVGNNSDGYYIATRSYYGSIYIGVGPDTLDSYAQIMELDENLDVLDIHEYSDYLTINGLDVMGDRLAVRGRYLSEVHIDTFGHTVGDSLNGSGWYNFMAMYDPKWEAIYSQRMTYASLDRTHMVNVIDDAVYSFGRAISMVIKTDTGAAVHHNNAGFMYGLKIRYWPDALEDLERENSQLLLFPNPSCDRIQIKCLDAWKPERLYICDVSSRILREQPYSREIDVRDLPTGTYILGLMDDQGNRRAAVFQKQ